MSGLHNHFIRRVAVIGFAWDHSDDDKLFDTFGTGGEVFGDLIDVQTIAKDLGYSRPGLANLAKQLLGYTMDKSSSVRCDLCGTARFINPVRTAGDAFQLGCLHAELSAAAVCSHGCHRHPCSFPEASIHACQPKHMPRLQFHAGGSAPKSRAVRPLISIH